jgi:small subunit ribosomal protein S24e
VQKTDVQKAIVDKLKVDDANKVFVFGFKVAFGGMKSTGFATVYNTMEDAYVAEPKHRLIKNKLISKINRPSRKIRKDVKNKRKRLPGMQKDRGKRKRASADDE